MVPPSYTFSSDLVKPFKIIKFIIGVALFLGSGFLSSTLGAPFLLGVLGDSLGISRAYIMVPILIAIAMIIIVKVPSHEDTNVIKN